MRAVGSIPAVDPQQMSSSHRDGRPRDAAAGKLQRPAALPARYRGNRQTWTDGAEGLTLGQSTSHPGLNTYVGVLRETLRVTRRTGRPRRVKLYLTLITL